MPEEKPLGARERTQATLVGGECSHHSVTLAPQRFTVVKVIAPCRVQTDTKLNERYLERVFFFIVPRTEHQDKIGLSH